MREKIQRFMIGRYGADELAKAQSDRTDDLFHMENVLEEYFRKICRKSEISQLQISDGCEVEPVQKASGTEKKLQILQMSAM